MREFRGIVLPRPETRELWVCLRPQGSDRRPADETCFTLRLSSRRVCSLRRRQFILILKGFFNRKSAENSINHTNKFFSFCYFSITYRFSEQMEAGGRTTVESVGLPQSRQSSQ